MFDPGSGSLLLLDRENSTVVSVGSDGSATVLAGDASAGSPALRAPLGNLVAINFAPSGFVLVERPPGQGNRVVRIDTAAGALTEVPVS